MPKNIESQNNESDNNAMKNERLSYLRRWRRLEHLWVGLLLVSLFVLLFYQSWLYFDKEWPLPWPELRISSENWYGTDYAEVVPAVQHTDGLWGNVTLELQDYSEMRRAVVLLNSEETASFVSDTLTLRVFDGDLLEIDCTAYSRPVRFRLLKTSSGIDRTVLKAEIELRGERASVGQINFK